MPRENDIVALLWDTSSSLLERVLALMQQPFPTLISLRSTAIVKQ
jgi:hypothetical protein